MKYVAVLTVFLFMPVLSYGMEVDLEALEEGTGGGSFHQEVANLKTAGLISEDERDLENQIAGLSEVQRDKLLAGRTTRSGMQGGGGGLWQWLSGANQADGESVYLLRDLHRIALEELEERRKLSKQLKFFLFITGTGLLGSLGANGGLLNTLFGADASTT